MAKERYEHNGRMYVEYEVVDDDTVKYSYGVVGFGESGGGVLAMSDYRNARANLVAQGYVPVAEAPASESGAMDGSILLDWVGGVTR